MTSRFLRWTVVVTLLGLGVLALGWLGRGSHLPSDRRGEIEFAAAESSPPEFDRVYSPRPFAFPEDHGPHPRFRTEWWYFTGNLFTPAEAHFGYQLTIFRNGLTPFSPERESDLATDQIYFAHFALSRPGGEYTSAERFSRGAGGLAGSVASPPSFWLEDWNIDAVDAVGDAFAISASEGELSVDLELTSLKPIVAHGETGVSRKGTEAGNASFYLSETRLATHGTVHDAAGTWEVSGTSWYDHEWGTTVLPPEAIGWDWFGLQLEDDRELMLYRIRREDGSFESVSAGTLVERDGSVTRLAAGDFEIESTAIWSSPRSGATYPSGWLIRIPAMALELEVEPFQTDQEVSARVVYWEGAVRVTGRSRGVEIRGVGFVELTGYAESMQGQF